MRFLVCTFDDGKIGVVENTEKGSRSPSEDIVNGDLVSLLEVKGDHGGTEVTSTAGNEDGFNVLIVSWDSHFYDDRTNVIRCRLRKREKSTSSELNRLAAGHFTPPGGDNSEASFSSA
ncbi:unnamed protein product [Oikopleura dioica]|uniref:Uncharacterized protein n=1 Tax=Oikopleura dioica TaxID=34765 RepID=E4XUK6_OIKDI|nr:unnamed protein product [Oikopleura dioica]